MYVDCFSGARTESRWELEGIRHARRSPANRPLPQSSSGASR